MLLAVGAACGGSAGPDTSVGRPRPGGTTSDTVGGGGRSGDPGIPIHVAISLGHGEELQVGEPFPLTTSLWTDVDVATVRSRVTAAGSVEVVEAAGAEWRGVATGQRVSAGSTLRVTGGGGGEIRATAEVVGPEGAVAFSSTAALDVLATPTEVLTGTQGPLALELEHLEHERAAERLTEEQFRQMREHVLGAGAS